MRTCADDVQAAEEMHIEGAVLLLLSASCARGRRAARESGEYRPIAAVHKGGNRSAPRKVDYQDCLGACLCHMQVTRMQQELRNTGESGFGRHREAGHATSGRRYDGLEHWSMH